MIFSLNFFQPARYRQSRASALPPVTRLRATASQAPAFYRQSNVLKAHTNQSLEGDYRPNRQSAQGLAKGPRHKNTSMAKAPRNQRQSILDQKAHMPIDARAQDPSVQQTQMALGPRTTSPKAQDCRMASSARSQKNPTAHAETPEGPKKQKTDQRPRGPQQDKGQKSMEMTQDPSRAQRVVKAQRSSGMKAQKCPSRPKTPRI